MRRCRHLNVAVLVFSMVLAGLSWVQAAAGANDQPDPNEPPTIRLTLYPAEPPAIAMKYRLLPRYLELVPGNAAVQYLKILAEGGADELKKQIDKTADLLEQPLEDFDIQQARKVLRDIGDTPFEFLRLGSLRADCEWDLPIHEQELYSMLLSDAQEMRNFVRYLALRARVQIVERRFDDAIDTLRVGYALARNVGKGPTLIHALVGRAISGFLNKQLLELIETPGAPNLYWSVAALPDPLIDARQAMELEAGSVYLMFPQLKDVATTRLTDEQWGLRLGEFAQALNKMGPLMGTDAEARRWQDKLALGVGMAAVAVVKYPKAKADLETYGWSKAQLDAMAVPQVILLHIGQTYEVICDESFKWFHIPYWQAERAMREVEKQFASKAANREILPLASLLMPAINAARLSLIRNERQFAAIRTVEALRFYAARHDGKLPEALADIKEVPVPLDPMTGKDFDYKLKGQTATLEGRASADRATEIGAFRYIIAIAKTAEGESAERPKMTKSADGKGALHGAQVVKVVTSTGKTLIDVTTTNPVWKFGESARRRQSIDNLKNIGLAMANYHDVYKHFPPAASVDKNGKPLLSWRVHVLPYLDQAALYRQFKLDEPWDSEHNKKLIEKMPDVYRVPALPSLPNYTTSYLVPVGEETIFHDGKGTPIKDVKDGTSKTILVLEADADQAVVWTKPEDWQFDTAKPTRGLGKLRNDTILAAFAEVSVHRLSAKHHVGEIPKLMTRAGGETIDLR